MRSSCSLFQLQEVVRDQEVAYTATQKPVPEFQSNFKKDQEICEEVVLEANDGPLTGQDKYLGGTLGADGCVYGVPGTNGTVGLQR